MGLICEIFGHKWKDCRCVRCGGWRNEGHHFHATDNPCEQRCPNCGFRNETHVWEGTGCVKTCKTCGKTTGEHHWKYQDEQVICAYCGATKHKLYRSIFNNPVTEYTCELCGKYGGNNDCRDYGCDFLKASCVK